MVAARNIEQDNINLVQAVGLAMKMVKIMQAVGNVAKGGRNDFQKYDFVQSDDVLDAVRTEMVKNNVVLFPRMIGYEQNAETKGYHVVVQFEFTLIDADSGETMSGTWFGEASDFGDKSFSKAGTSALKYWLLKTFMISANEPDADKDSPEHGHEGKSAKDKLRGNGQQDRRIPPRSNSTSPNQSATQSQGSGDQNAANGALNANSDELDKPAAEKMIKHYEGKLTQDQLLEALHVTRFSEWTQGKKAAFVAIENHLRLATMAAGTTQ